MTGVRILDRYMAAAFARPFGFSLLLFAMLVFLGHLFDHLTVLLRTQASASTIVAYLGLQVPYWTIRIVPVATLLATLLCISELVRSGEWVAILASGYRPAQVLRPLAVCAGAIAVLTFAAQETVLPWAFHRAKTIYELDIRRKTPQTVWRDVVLISGPNQFLMARVFEPKEGRISRVVMDIHDGERTQLDALEARWDGARWVFYNGVRRTFKPGELLPVEETPFDEFASELRSKPSALVPETREPDEMSLPDTVRHMAKLHRLGASTRQAEVALHSKIAFPLANLIIFALGVPFGLRMRRVNRAWCFAQALGLSFAYWWILSMGQTLGETGWVAPWAGAWVGNLVFGAWGAWGLLRAGL